MDVLSSVVAAAFTFFAFAAALEPFATLASVEASTGKVRSEIG